MTPSVGSAPTVSGVSGATRDWVGVLVVDDQTIFLDAAQDVVAGTPGFRWVGGATSGEEAIEAISELEPALVLLDVRMPGMDGIETAHRICGTHPDIVVVLISVDESPALTSEIEASGASVLVRKRDFGPAMLRRLWRTHRKS
jgi:DNA-binding NarL/FixJ family response regulator